LALADASVNNKVSTDTARLGGFFLGMTTACCTVKVATLSGAKQAIFLMLRATLQEYFLRRMQITPKATRSASRLKMMASGREKIMLRARGDIVRIARNYGKVGIAAKILHLTLDAAI
jgi:hypothetical protein